MKACRQFSILLGLLAISLNSAASAQIPDPRSEPIYTADSVVLERTPCFGTCPAYRLSVARSGMIHFESRNPGEDGRRAMDSIPSNEFQTILVRAHFLEFLSLPDRIADDKRFCPHAVTDNPTTIITIFIPGKAKRVEDYHGCDWAPAGLRDLETYVDQVTNAKRWIRPARRS
jgi:uncharacterized protein DUF6438